MQRLMDMSATKHNGKYIYTKRVWQYAEPFFTFATTLALKSKTADMNKLFIALICATSGILVSCEKSTECCNASSYCETLNAQDFQSNDAYNKAVKDYEANGFTCK